MARRTAANGLLSGTVRSRLALVSVLAALIVLLGPVAPASAAVHCLAEARGVTTLGDSFKGEAVINTDVTATGKWWHRTPTVRAPMVGKVETGICTRDGRTILQLWGSGRWGSQSVDFSVFALDGSSDEYDIAICEPAPPLVPCGDPATTVIYASGLQTLASGDISAVVQ